MKMLRLLYRPSYHLRPRYSNSIVSSLWLLGQSRYSTRAASEEAPTHQHVTHMAEDKARDKASEAGAHENLRVYQRDYQEEYRDRNREKIRAAQRLYREQNKDKIERWYQEHKEEAKAYRDQNKDKMKAYTARYHQQHKQRVAELVRQWNKKNPSRRYEYGRQLSLKRLVNYPGPHINLYCMTRDNHITALVAVMAGTSSFGGESWMKTGTQQENPAAMHASQATGLELCRLDMRTCLSIEDPATARPQRLLTTILRTRLRLNQAKSPIHRPESCSSTL